jgi:hypothetical protein
MAKDEGKGGDSKRGEGVHQSKDGTYHFPPGTKAFPTKEGGYKVKAPKEK